MLIHTAAEQSLNGRKIAERKSKQENTIKMFDNRKIRKSSLIYDLIIDFDSLSRPFAAAPFLLPFCTHLNFDYFIFLIFYYFLSFHRCLLHPARCSVHFNRPAADVSNPNEAKKQETMLPASKERSRFRGITWDQYDSVHQKYLEIGKVSILPSFRLSFLFSTCSCHIFCETEMKNVG